MNQLGTDCPCHRIGLAAGVDGPPDNRGWIPTVCKHCGRFFGRRPPDGERATKAFEAAEVETTEDGDAEDLGS